MQTLKWVIVTGLVGYAALVALLYVAQRGLMYFPETRRTPPAEAGLPQASEETVATADGEQVVLWHVPPQPGEAVIVYFHGNGGSLRYRADRFRALVASGLGLVALSYRGYGGSTGRPSESGLMHDAAATYDFATARHASAPLFLWGESLGSGVAVPLAATRAVGGLILESPFTSAAAVAAAVYPFVPVRWLMWDQFRSDEQVGAVGAPVLVLHGARDRVVPIAFGEALFGRVRAPKRFVRFPDGGHNDLDAHGALRAARDFIEAPPR